MHTTALPERTLLLCISSFYSAVILPSHVGRLFTPVLVNINSDMKRLRDVIKVVQEYNRLMPCMCWQFVLIHLLLTKAEYKPVFLDVYVYSPS